MMNYCTFSIQSKFNAQIETLQCERTEMYKIMVSLIGRAITRFISFSVCLQLANDLAGKLS